MYRSTQFLTTMLAGLGVCLFGPAAHAGIVAIPPPGPARIAKADAVIVGKVEALEPMDIKVGNTTYRIAVVKISQGLKGTKDAKTLKIGFLPIPKPMDDGPGPKLIRTGPRPIQLQEGQEGLFILKKHAKEDFYTIGGVIGYFFNNDKNKDFDQQVQTAKAIVKAVENPQTALKSKDADERLIAAAILIDQYRTYRGPTSKLEPVGAEDSKQIMQVLADADWQAAGDMRALRPTAAQLFRQLHVTAMDGFTVPAGANYQATAQTWVRENAQKYRIQRFVASDAK